MEQGDLFQFLLGSLAEWEGVRSQELHLVLRLRQLMNVASKGHVVVSWEGQELSWESDPDSWNLTGDFQS